MELIYIGTDESIFIRGNKYRLISFTEGPYQRLRVLCDVGIFHEYSTDTIWNDFTTLSEARNQKLESIGI